MKKLILTIVLGLFLSQLANAADSQKGREHVWVLNINKDLTASEAASVVDNFIETQDERISVYVTRFKLPTLDNSKIERERFAKLNIYGEIERGCLSVADKFEFENKITKSIVYLGLHIKYLQKQMGIETEQVRCILLDEAIKGAGYRIKGLENENLL